MPYFLNTHFPDTHKVHTALTRVYGIGISKSKQICACVGIGTHTRIAQLNGRDISRITDLVSQEIETDTQVRRARIQNIQRLIKIGSYRGFRHTEGLPVRGQRTHGNSRTARACRVPTGLLRLY